MNELSYLCTLADVRRELNANETIDDDYLMGLIPPVSRELNLACNEQFEPTHETFSVFPSPVTISPDRTVLEMRDAETHRPIRLLEVEAVTNGTRVLLVDDPDPEVSLYSGQPSRKLMLNQWCQYWDRVCGCVANSRRVRYSVTITGWKGYREGYPLAGWSQVDTVDQDMEISGDDLFIRDGTSGFAANGTTPKLSPGALFKIEDELLRFYAADTGDDEHLLCRRGQNGTTAVAHVAGEEGLPLMIWSVEPDIVRAAQRWVNLLYSRRGTFDTATITDIGMIKHPGDMPDDVKAFLWRFLNR